MKGGTVSNLAQTHRPTGWLGGCVAHTVPAAGMIGLLTLMCNWPALQRMCPQKATQQPATQPGTLPCAPGGGGLLAAVQLLPGWLAAPLAASAGEFSVVL